MRTDPRAACANAEEKFWWAWVHDAICHPLMAVTNWSGWSVRFHDWTSFRAWPRATSTEGQCEIVSRHHGVLTVTFNGHGIFSVRHPAIGHTFTTLAGDAVEAVEHAEAWFNTLVDVGIYPHGVGKGGQR